MTAPPRLAVWLLETLLPEESREAVIGDLVESHEPGVVAALRFWRETLVAVATLQLMSPDVPAFTPYRTETPMQAFLGDMRRALRTLWRARGFTLLCVLTLGVAIGATSAIYSVVGPVIMRPLPYPDADRLQLVSEREKDGLPSNIGYATYLDLRRDSRTIERAAAMGFWQPTIFGTQDAERVEGQSVTWEYFRTLGFRPALGRDFEPAEDAPGMNTVVILSHALWVRRFGSDPDVIGTTINTSGVSRRIIGVMPASFDNALSTSAQLWRPLGYPPSDPPACRTCRHLRMVARMRAGVSDRQFADEMDALLDRIATEHPKEYASTGASVDGVQHRMTARARPVLLAVFGAALLVLLIGTANVVSLQLARFVRRQDEFALRAALGAGRGRLAIQLLAEGTVIAVAGGVAGVAIGRLMLPLLVARLPEGLPRVSDIRMDHHALGFVALSVCIVALVIGLVPALQRSQLRLFDSLRAANRSVGVARHRVRQGLVVGEIALALMLLVGVALLAESLRRLLDVNPGFDASHLLTMEVQATGPQYPDIAAVAANHERMLAAVRAVPGVEDVALATQLPLTGGVDRYGVAAQDKPLDNPELAPSGDRYLISGDFLRTMRIPVLRGRNFDPAEFADSTAQVVIVSRALADRIWPGEDAVGKYIRLGGESRPWKRVVGIAGNVRHDGLDAGVTQQVYVPERQWFWEENAMTLVVRTHGDPKLMTGPIFAAARSVDPLQPISGVRTMDAIRERSTSQRRLGLLLFLAFGAIALLLSAAGVYGILAGVVAERTREFGVRAAMGATPGMVVALVVRQAGTLAIAGVVIGGALALALSRYLRALLFGIQPTDPLALVLAIVVVGVAALAACVVPARRAARVDPVTALRAD